MVKAVDPADPDFAVYANFDGGYALPGGTAIPPGAQPLNADCVTAAPAFFNYNMVFVPDGYDAVDLCRQAWNADVVGVFEGTEVWGCLGLPPL